MSGFWYFACKSDRVKDSASVSEERTLNVMVTNVVRSKFMKVVSRVGCKHLHGIDKQRYDFETGS